MKHTTIEQADEFYRTVLSQAEKDNCVLETTAELGKKDLYFLLTRILKRSDIRHPWMFDRCKEVQEEPNNCLDLWPREHRKSTIITFALTIQDLVTDPELCIAIFSLTRPIAKAFLYQIKWELETNELLKQLYPDALWQNPKKEAPKWTLDEGIVLKRKKNPKECSLEAFGFIEGLPTSRHYQIRLYDDMIDQDNVTNPDTVRKAIEQWELSQFLGSDVIVPRYGVADIERYIGTRYRNNDVYGHIKDKNIATVREHKATDDGTPLGKAVYFSEELLASKREKLSAFQFACQMLMNPQADSVDSFNTEDIQSWWPDMIDSNQMNRYIIVDPASSKKKTSDFTSIMVYGLNVDNNIYLLDGIRDRMNLTERTVWLFRMHRKWRPLASGYEQYGQQADIEHIEFIMNQENYRFSIIPLGGKVSKEDRIRGLIPIIEKHRYYVPLKLMYQDYEGNAQDLAKIHIQEFNDFPVGMYDDTIDNTARILDPNLGAEFPELDDELPFSGDVTMAKTEYSLFGD